MDNFKIKDIVIATGNKGKAKEFSDLLKGFDCKILNLEDFEEISEPEEYGKTFAENALTKARYYSKHTNFTVIADDSGLEVDILEGKPGVHSARFAINENGQQDFNFAASKLEKLIQEKGVDTRSADSKYSLKANFTCSIALYTPKNIYLICEGKVNGRLQFPASGNGGFGYDPIFIADGYDKTFAEISLKEKQSIGHRAIAFKKLKEILNIK